VLVLVVGPSGAGKDTLIAAAREALRADPRFVFPSRIITRPEAIGEPHTPVSKRAFAKLAGEGAFFLDWLAHGLSYGLPAHVADDLAAGRIVVVNVSRGMIEAARAKWQQTRVVNVTVALDVLRERLQARGREDTAGIGRRLARAVEVSDLDAGIDQIDNSGDPAHAVGRFNALLESYAAAASGKRPSRQKGAP
jgi:phosphonate metabolism protein PhnN/1,5-bisphosphokinase (PRPP-forming)